MLMADGAVSWGVVMGGNPRWGVGEERVAGSGIGRAGDCACGFCRVYKRLRVTPAMESVGSGVTTA